MFETPGAVQIDVTARNIGTKFPVEAALPGDDPEAPPWRQPPAEDLEDGPALGTALAGVPDWVKARLGG